MTIKQIISDTLTEKDGTSACPVRIAFIVSILAYLTGTAHDVFFIDGFKFMEHAKDWASGLADLLGFGGAAIAGKSFTEPNP